MKRKVLIDSPNRIVQILKATFIIALFMGTSNALLAQNPNANENATVYGGEITFMDGEKYTSVCVGDGEADYVQVVLENASGRVKQWIVTNEDGDILGLPDNPSDVNFDGAGVGICYIYHLSYNGIKPLVDPSGQGKFTKNVNDIVGRFDLSEPIMVERFLQPTPGVLEGGPFEFCVNDGEPDYIPEGAITLSGNSSTNEVWVVTDSDGNILGLPPTPYDVNFDEAPEGVCLVWHLGYEDNVSFDGVTNANDLMGCFELSNPISVNRIQQPEGGDIALADGSTEIEICAGDGVSDLFEVTLTGASGGQGVQMLWVITDADANILAVSNDNSFDLEGAGEGICLIWNLSYAENVSLEGVTNAGQLMGCYDLSNPITVNRIQQPEGGDIALADGSTAIEICAGDGISDAFDVTLTGASGGQDVQMLWVITDADANILDTSDTNTFDLEGAPEGVCLIWHLSYAENVSLDGVTNAGDLMGCYDLSNPITVTRIQQPEGGDIALADGSTAIEICAGDGNSDLFELTLTGESGGQGVNMLWVITDADANILDVSNDNSFDLEGAGDGVCLIWHLSYAENVSLEGVTNAGDLMGCYDLSNPITVTRNGVNGGTLTGGTDNTFNFTVDDTEDKIPADAITLEGNIGTNSAWVVTNEDGTIILGLPANYADVDFNAAGVGVCKIWHLSYEDGLIGTVPPEEGDHLVSGLEGCFSLSNPITVNRTAPSTSKVSVFPNPAKSSVNVDYSGFKGSEVNIRIFNLRSLQLSSKDYSTRIKRAKLNVENYEQGLYFIKVTDKVTGESSIKRLVIQ